MLLKVFFVSLKKLLHSTSRYIQLVLQKSCDGCFVLQKNWLEFNLELNRNQIHYLLKLTRKS